MTFRRLSSLLTVVLLAVASCSSSVFTTAQSQQCKTARVRRSWTALSPSDRDLYKDAIVAAMDSGAYIKFVEIHTEMMSEREAHGQCMFIYWHRAFLTAFENMLRGQHARFACVTVPYWDWVTDYSKFASGKCTNVRECSPALSYIGDPAPVARGERNVTINGEPIEGFCTSGGPLNQFCQDSQSTGDQCIKCVPRGDWSNETFPGSASVASVRAQLFGSNNIGELSVAIELGVHNDMHGALGGVMISNESPSEPLFWSHHAMVDLLHSIFHKCKVGEQKMTFAQKVTSPGWSSCQRRNSTADFLPTDRVMMRTGFHGIKTVDATQDPLVGEYVAAVPQQFAALMDIRDLGASSYTYELEGHLASLFTECGASGASSPKQSPIQQAVPVAMPTLSQSVAAQRSATLLPTMTSLIHTTTDTASLQVESWVRAADETARSLGGDAVLDAEKMVCLFQDECLGGVTTYSPEFIRRFGITSEPRCKQIVDRIHDHTNAVAVTAWKAQMVASFGCPKPKPNEVNAAEAKQLIGVPTPLPVPAVREGTASAAAPAGANVTTRANFNTVDGAPSPATVSLPAIVSAGASTSFENVLRGNTQ